MDHWFLIFNHTLHGTWLTFFRAFFPFQFDDGEVAVDVDCTPMPSESEGEEGAEEGDAGELDGYRVIITFKNDKKPDVMQVRAWYHFSFLFPTFSPHLMSSEF